jgi:hypothetical protein
MEYINALKLDIKIFGSEMTLYFENGFNFITMTWHQLSLFFVLVADLCLECLTVSIRFYKRSVRFCTQLKAMVVFCFSSIPFSHRYVVNI